MGQDGSKIMGWALAPLSPVLMFHYRTVLMEIAFFFEDSENYAEYVPVTI
jgi:hypothetical protein